MGAHRADVHRASRRLVALAGLLVSAEAATGGPFIYISPPLEVTPGSTGSWADVDVSGTVPSGATGVILQMVNTAGTAYHYGCRNNGSSDTWMLGAQKTAVANGGGFYMVGVDSNRFLEVYMENAAVKTYLVGYTKTGVTFFTNAANKSLGSTAAFVDIDISGDTGAATATGAIFIVKHTGSPARNFALRKKGSTDDRYTSLAAGHATGVLIGVDASEICEMKIQNTAVDAYLVGYVTSGAVLFTDGVDKSTATTASYVDVDITANIGSDDANGAILEFSSSNAYNTAVRLNGATYDYYKLLEHDFGLCTIDSGDVFEQKIAHSNMDVFLVGYTLGMMPPTMSSAANQAFVVGDSSTAISTITVTEVDGTTITTANDIRIRIPSGFDMLWDTSDTTAAIGGTASAKVSTTVSYEDSGATLVLNVTSNFAAGETVTASGLNFTSFDAASSSDNLELEVYNDNVVTATDDKTIEITAPPGGGGGSGSFVYLGSPVDVTPGATGAWTDVNVSAYVAAGATGVILQMVNPSGTYNWGCRNNSSTDTWMLAQQVDPRQAFFMIGVDSNRIFEVYNEHSSTKTYLLGYTTSGVTFFTNGLDKSPGSADVFVDTNISADTGAATAVGAIFIVKDIITSRRSFALRKKGSTDDRYSSLYAGTVTGAVIGVDGSEICQVKVENGTEIKVYLVGYITSGAAFFTNALNKSTGTTGSYVDVDITADIGADDANGVLLEFHPTDDSSFVGAVRSNGQTHDYYYKLRHHFAFAGVDGDDIFEQKVDATVADLYLVGYTTGSADGSDVTNYRSVGTNSGTIYSTGLASIPSGSSTVTFGGGASLPANVGQGDKLTIGMTEFYMLSRDSSTQATVQETASSTLSDQGYTIARAYNDLQGWETARQGDLVAEARTEVAVAYDDGDFTGALTISGSTTDSTHCMEVTVASGQRHAGQSGAGAVLDLNNSATGITVSDDYTRIGWLQVRRTGGADARAGVDVTNASNVVLDSLLVYDFNGAANVYGIHGGANSGATIRNCVLYDGTGRGIVADAADSTFTLQNCTVYGITGRGVSKVSGTLTATNMIAMGCSIEDFGSGLTQSYNMSSDASASGTGSLPSRTASSQLQYVTANNINLHLKAGSDAIDAGSDLSGSFTADIDNGSRSVPWDIGADESAATGAGQKQTPRIATWRETAP